MIHVGKAIKLAIERGRQHEAMSSGKLRVRFRTEWGDGFDGLTIHARITATGLSWYTKRMSNTKTPTLEEALEAVRKLPEAEQTVIAQEILAMAEHGVLPPVRSPEDQAIIKERVNQPFIEVPREEIDVLFDGYKSPV